MGCSQRSSGDGPMITGLKPYSTAKPSGAEWLGDVPGHWEVRRIKSLYREVDERSSTGSEELMSVSHKTGVTSRKQNVTMFLAESNVGYKVCRPGDIVVNTMWAYMAALGVARREGLVSPSYGVYRPLDHNALNDEYIDSLLRTEAYRSAYLSRSTGITASRLRLYAESFLSIPLLRPPLPEQQTIGRYLGHMNRRIQRYISAKRRRIELLEEERQAVVAHTVTRGLDPGVPFKPSGVDWMGDVPGHWEVRRLRTAVKNVVDFARGLAGDDVYLALEHVESWTGRYVASDEDRFESQVKRFKAGDVLFGKLRPYLAKVARPSQDGVCVGEFLVLRPSDAGVSGPYLEYLLRSKPIIDTVNGSTFGAKMPRADWLFIGGLRIPIPPVTEQAAIVAHVAEASADIKTAIARARRQIELMEEYRTRLVADIVTGKLDVREAAEMLPHQDIGDSWLEEGPSADLLGDDDGILDEPAEGLTIEGEVTA